MLKINGVDIKTPKSFKSTINDVDGKSERNANGDMVRDRIAVKRKLECEWGPLTQSECSTLLNTISSIFFTVTYPDPQLGTTTKTFYVGDRNTPAYRYKDNEVLWEGLSLNFIER
jgi:hypothetical protein